MIVKSEWQLWNLNILSVLLEETIENLNIKPNGVYVDGTLGGAGHSHEILKRLGEGGRLIGIDQDGEAIAAAKKRLAEYGDKVTIVRDNYQNFKSILDELTIFQVDGILLDIGVSSYQLDNVDRGFTYRVDAPLDMRMDDRQTKTAKDIVNGYSEQELFRILREYGEERFAKKHCISHCNVSVKKKGYRDNRRTECNYPKFNSCKKYEMHRDIRRNRHFRRFGLS